MVKALVGTNLKNSKILIMIVKKLTSLSYIFNSYPGTIHFCPVVNFENVTYA